MYHRRTAIFCGAAALSSFLALGAGAAAWASGAPPTSSAYEAPASAPPPLHLDIATTASLHAVSSVVNGKQEKILANAQGLPLYYFKADTAKKSKVTGELARLWPPLTGSKPTGNGVAGKLTSIPNTGGRQVAYNGHFLYSFVEDSPGHVTGQGVSGFFVATPGLKATSNASKAQVTAPTAPQGTGYGY